MSLRPISLADHGEVLALNERNVELLAPLDEDRLVQLVGLADTGHVIDVDGAFAGFVITFASGSAYDGENFGWFGDRFDDFCYLDRVVIHEDFRRRGLGSQVYDELESTCGRSLFALEVNLDPPNDASLAFHHARRFVEVGQRVSSGHLVSMFLKTLPSA
ncbi:MAG: family N-acetyltransferase [Marmoricola sp.]|jgi:predicted GNAT superfamily acetyltransferase|nr:family N-acetyltransferase [Marmoricola sp.]MCW2823064.1 family N-acetyltransferase [Marmoricola sp.]